MYQESGTRDTGRLTRSGSAKPPLTNLPEKRQSPRLSQKTGRKKTIIDEWWIRQAYPVGPASSRRRPELCVASRLAAAGMVSVAGAGAGDWPALSVCLRRKCPTILLRASGERAMGERGLGAGLHSQTVGRIEGFLWFCEQGDHQSPVHERKGGGRTLHAHAVAS